MPSRRWLSLQRETGFRKAAWPSVMCSPGEDVLPASPSLWVVTLPGCALGSPVHTHSPHSLSPTHSAHCRAPSAGHTGLLHGTDSLPSSARQVTKAREATMWLKAHYFISGDQKPWKAASERYISRRCCRSLSQAAGWSREGAGGRGCGVAS